MCERTRCIVLVWCTSHNVTYFCSCGRVSEKINYVQEDMHLAFVRACWYESFNSSLYGLLYHYVDNVVGILTVKNGTNHTWWWRRSLTLLFTVPKVWCSILLHVLDLITICLVSIRPRIVQICTQKSAFTFKQSFDSVKLLPRQETSSNTLLPACASLSVVK